MKDELVIQKLKEMSIEDQAKQDVHGSSITFLPLVLGGVLCIILYKYDVLEFPLFLSCLCGCIILTFIWWRKSDKEWQEYNEIIYKARDARALSLKNAEEEKKRIAQEEKELKLKEKELKKIERENLYGEDRLSIEYGYKSSKSILISEKNELICINETDYKFSDIIDFKLVDNRSESIKPAQYETKTSTGSMIGRAVVGGILTGGVGAVIGAATAKKKTVQTSKATKKVSHTYSIIVNVNSFSKPQEEIFFWSDQRKANEVASYLTLILNKNHSDNK